MYNYLENMIEDVKEYIKENDIDVATIDETDLYDDLFIEDAITGNASGSYYCNTWKAKEALQGNEDLLQQTIDTFCIDMNEHWNDYEYLDVSVRCYLLADAIADALNDLR